MLNDLNQQSASAFSIPLGVCAAIVDGKQLGHPLSQEVHGVGAE